MLARLRSYMTVNTLLFVGLCMAIFGGSYTLSTYLKPILQPVENEYVITSRTKESFLTAEHYLKKGTGPYTFIEYIDLDCPHCKKFYTAQEAYLREHNPDATFIVRHFPLIEWHPGATDKAIATECVYAQRGESTFNELLRSYFFEHDITMSTSTFFDLGETYVDDAQAYRACLTSEDARESLRNHVKQGLYAGIFSTPSIVVLKDDVFLARYDLLTDTTGIGVLEHYLTRVP